MRLHRTGLHGLYALAEGPERRARTHSPGSTLTNGQFADNPADEQPNSTLDVWQKEKPQPLLYIIGDKGFMSSSHAIGQAQPSLFTDIPWKKLACTGIVYYLDRGEQKEANIASNQALLQQLQLNDAPTLAFVPVATSKTSTAKGKGPAKSRASTGGNKKAAQPRKTSGVKRKSRGGGKGDDDDTDSEDEIVVRRMSTRRGRRAFIDPNETPEQKAAREKEEERRAIIEEQERLEALELAQKAKQPRHGDLELKEALKGDKWGSKD
ncbi:10310_t:CDS:2, partial [Acaulospora colombiana]